MTPKKPSILGDDINFDEPLPDTVTPAHAEIMNDYGIDPNAPLIERWKEFAEKLAEKYHPNFRKRQGRPAHKNHAYYGTLIGSVRWIRERDGLSSDKAALKFLYDNNPALLVGWDRKDKIPSINSLETDLKTARALVINGAIDII